MLCGAPGLPLTVEMSVLMLHGAFSLTFLLTGKESVPILHSSEHLGPAASEWFLLVICKVLHAHSVDYTSDPGVSTWVVSVIPLVKRSFEYGARAHS